MVAQTRSYGILSDILTAVLVTVHVILSVIDFGGFFPVADFLVRPDGSQMDPTDMLPMEQIFVALCAFPFLIIAMSFGLLSSRREAAILSAAVHAVYAVYLQAHHGIWDALMHPNSELVSTDFFIISHGVWTFVSVIIWRLPAPKAKKSAKSK